MVGGHVAGDPGQPGAWWPKVLAVGLRGPDGLEEDIGGEVGDEERVVNTTGEVEADERQVLTVERFELLRLRRERRNLLRLAGRSDHHAHTSPRPSPALHQTARTSGRSSPGADNTTCHRIAPSPRRRKAQSDHRVAIQPKACFSSLGKRFARSLGRRGSHREADPLDDHVIRVLDSLDVVITPRDGHSADRRAECVLIP